MDIIGVMDLLLHRYGSLDVVGCMPFRQGFKLVQKAYEERDRDKWYQVWLVQRPTDGKYIISFDKWYSDLKQEVRSREYQTSLSKDAIMDHVDEIRRRAAK